MNNESNPLWTPQPEILYFGCIGQSGHCLKSKINPNIRYHETAWGNELDGGLFPNQRTGYADGTVHYAEKNGWSGMAVADNSVDSRPGSHSTFVTNSILPAERILELARAQWPEVFSRPRFPRLKLKPAHTFVPVEVVEALVEKWIEGERKWRDAANHASAIGDSGAFLRRNFIADTVQTCRRELQEAVGLALSREQVDGIVKEDTIITLAKSVATKAHAGQFRRDGKTPYIEHCRAVVTRLGACSPLLIATAWLHDVIEDTTETAGSLLAAGVPKSVVDAVVAMTKVKDETYNAYLRRVAENPIARKVKVADMLSNLVDQPTDSQIRKYANGLLALV